MTRKERFALYRRVRFWEKTLLELSALPPSDSVESEKEVAKVNLIYSKKDLRKALAYEAQSRARSPRVYRRNDKSIRTKFFEKTFDCQEYADEWVRDFWSELYLEREMSWQKSAWTITKFKIAHWKGNLWKIAIQEQNFEL